MHVFVNGERLRARRLARRTTVDKLAERAGVSARTLHTLEKSARVRSTVVTAESLAGALEMEEGALLVRDDDEDASADAIPPPRVKRAPSRLDALAAREPPTPPSDTPPPMTARAMKRLLTAFAIYEGERYIVDGRLDDHRALTKAEARLLGTKVGVGGRFHVMRVVVGTEELGITVHTTRAADTRALLARKGKPVRLEVRVLVAPDDEVDGFVFFRSPTLTPWALVVEAILPRE